MARRITLGGKWGGLYVIKYKDKYEFYNHSYGMVLELYKEDVSDYLSHQEFCHWGAHSNSNAVSDEDKRIIKDYLLNKSRKYKTVTDVLKSRCRHKEKMLRENYSLDELVEYKTKGES